MSSRPSRSNYSVSSSPVVERNYWTTHNSNVGYINAATMALMSPGVFFSIHLSDTRYLDLDLNSIKHSFVSAQDFLTV